jgi:hypothetical protein
LLFLKLRDARSVNGRICQATGPLSVGRRDAGRSVAAGQDKAKTAIEKGEIGERAKIR